jgi:hypothetical protein
MLFTDTTPADKETLRTFESAILDVAAGEGIDLDAKLQIAAEQVGDELEIWLKQAGSSPTSWVMDVGPTWMAPVLNSVVVSTAIRRWHALHTLESVYRDAYFQELNDRFKGKWQMYGELRREARDQAFAYGIGIVGAPIPIGPVPASGMALGDSDSAPVYVQLTWVSNSGAEGAPGAVSSMVAPIGAQVVVSLTQQAPAGCSWNVYAGASPDQLTLQNSAPLGQNDQWTQASPASTTGRLIGAGQTPDYILVDYRRIQRG